MSRPPRRAIAGAAVALLVAGSASAQRPEPIDAVVFIRVFATARAEYQDVWKKPLSIYWPGQIWLPTHDTPVVCPRRENQPRRPALSAVSPLQDFTQTLRIRGWFEYSTLEGIQKACREARAPNGYRVVAEFAGLQYRVAGFFVVVAGDSGTFVVQIEAVAPSDRGEKLYEWLLEWKTLLEKR